LALGSKIWVGAVLVEAAAPDVRGTFNDASDARSFFSRVKESQLPISRLFIHGICNEKLQTFCFLLEIEVDGCSLCQVPVSLSVKIWHHFALFLPSRIN